jgi:hypothetical protein
MAALCNWHMKTGLELESPVLKASSWISLFLAWKDLCRALMHNFVDPFTDQKLINFQPCRDNRPFASNGKTKRKWSVIYTS